MLKDSARAPIVHSKTISKRKIKSLNKQLEKIPEFWKERFKKDKWQMIITNNMPEEFGGAIVQYYADKDKKQVWINVEIPTLVYNIIYKAIACYAYMEYGNVRYSEVFSKIYKEKRKEISIFMTFRGALQYTEFQTFVELFSYVIETDGVCRIKSIFPLYTYLKKWVDGSIFNVNYSQIPAYIEVGTDVLEEQLEILKKSFLRLPARLQQDFITQKWKIRISNQEIVGNSTCGLCSSYTNKIYIKSSAPDIQITTWHEFGHYLDYRGGMISRKKFFKKIYHIERENLKRFYKTKSEYDYAVSSCEEYFAELFTNYLNDRNLLSMFIPQSVQIIEEILNNWN